MREKACSCTTESSLETIKTIRLTPELQHQNETIAWWWFTKRCEETISKPNDVRQFRELKQKRETRSAAGSSPELVSKELISTDDSRRKKPDRERESILTSTPDE